MLLAPLKEKFLDEVKGGSMFTARQVRSATARGRNGKIKG